MKIKLPFMLALFVFIIFARPLAYAVDAVPPPEDAVQAVEDSLVDLLDVLGNTKLSSDLEEAKKEMFVLMERNLSVVVDFKGMVKRIMGKHFAGASKELRNRFLEVFKKNLINSYGTFIASTDLKSLSEKLKYQVVAVPKSRKAGRAQVTVVFKMDGQSYEAVHAMKYNTKKKAWLLENLVVEGVNLGINFRNQFDRMMTRNNNDYDKVIEEWAGLDANKKKPQEG